MKAPRFWFQPLGMSAALLTPFGQCFRIGGKIRSLGKTPYLAKAPVICIGNVVAGGSGKTPVALTLARLLLAKGAKPVFVTRGYGGQEKGPLRVDLEHHTANDVGDEPLLLARVAPCWIGRDRAATVREAEKDATHILLDDGLQNPTIFKTASLLVIDGAVGIGNSQIIPAGPLRETLGDALQRVNAAVMIGEDATGLTPRLTKPVLRAHLEPRLPADFPRGKEFFAFAGIGRPEKFYASCRAIGLNIVSTYDFPDHYMFTQKDLSAFAEHARVRKLQLITTEKDWVRLPLNFRNQVAVFPVELVFEDAGAVMRMIQISNTVAE